MQNTNATPPSLIISERDFGTAKYRQRLSTGDRHDDFSEQQSDGTWRTVRIKRHKRVFQVPVKPCRESAPNPGHRITSSFASPSLFCVDTILPSSSYPHPNKCLMRVRFFVFLTIPSFASSNATSNCQPCRVLV